MLSKIKAAISDLVTSLSQAEMEEGQIDDLKRKLAKERQQHIFRH